MISIVIPCYCSEKTINFVVASIEEEFKDNSIPYEVILVNDGSEDGTLGVIEKLHNNNNNVVVIELSKNYGQHAARLSAIPYIRGEYIVYMDDDGQHPVDQIITIYRKLIDGNYDVVYGAFKKKKHGILKRVASDLNTRTLNFLTGKPKEVKNSSFSIMRKYILDEMQKYKSPFPSWTGFIVQLTTNISHVELAHAERIAGRSNYTLKKMFKLYLSSLTGFSIVPLRVSSVLGCICSLLGFGYGLFNVINKIINPNIVLGYTSLIAINLLTSGLVMLMLGLIGEYIGRIYMINNNMPQYTVKKVFDKRKINEK